ncbi:ATP-dependent DNA helicase [Paenibacillus spongiae]|uniref:ATP-dependent DNA helicase n=1 Tax=Paenibacillus spongiae TaxID=2909671 RepID=A0ABY5S8L6_9BACL|nr:ATP-dependent DNA helicase [Paenibacillus spongiae]UVI30064.1 ATP-dependent DNA helicase [Paenibacillus spongiae]
MFSHEGGGRGAKMVNTANTVQISVRALVEYVYRSGSIESGFCTAASLTDGTKAHQKIQKEYGEKDRKEVYVKTEMPRGDLLFVVDGRCDGLLETDEGLTVDEIKSTSGSLEAIGEDGYPVHWAQAICYAYMVAEEQGLPSMRIQLTYVQVNTEEQRRFVRGMTFGELAQFMEEMIRGYAPYAELRQRHVIARDSSMRALAFPFDAYREGQRKLAGSVYKSIADKRKLFAKAPTGTGKTISTLFPAVKAMGEGLLQRLFYLTAKTITRTAAEEALTLMQAGGLHMHTVTITAKEKVCFQEEMRCSKEFCEYADGYYDRVNAAMLDMLSQETAMTRQVVERYARKHKVCPFEFSLDAAYAADGIICDYNYIFDPRVSLKRLIEDQKRQTALLVDEAHNLVDRGREMYSAELNKADFLELQRTFKTIRADVYEASKDVNQHLLRVRKAIGERKTLVELEAPGELIELVEFFVYTAEKVLAAGSLGAEQGHAAALLLEGYFAASDFLRAAKLYDERYVTYTECFKSEVRIRMFCLDPSYLLSQMGKGFRSHIFFSATLSPLSFYTEMLGGSKEDYAVAIPSPFSHEQLEVKIQPLSTRYQDRERTKEPLARMIRQITEKQPGNYLVFFPSYAYMEDVYERFMTMDGGQTYADTLVQQTGMTEEERERFLAAFDAANARTLVGFAVMGGIFSEGIDLVGDRLNGVIVVGVGLPQLGLERNVIKDYFERTGRNGYDYAYVFPGMNKVLQAGGRLIRSERDSGTLVLVDDRYLQPQYQRLLPEEWRSYSVVNIESLY